jgi:peptidoglycan/xylan/chitin deacetylase (PgdA/CDA1 family)
MRILLILLSVYFLFPNITVPQTNVFDIPVFAYHRFDDDRYPSTNISGDVFEQQLKYLAENDFTVITFGEAYERMKSGQKLSEKSVILTIDDGYLSFYTHGWPLLKKYGFHATIFIQTETVGGDDFMTWSQIREIREAGIGIGNHSSSHAFFVNIPQNERQEAFRNDLLKSQKAFAKQLGDTPEYYAYPYGEYSKDMKAVLKQEGIKASAVQQSGVFSESSDIYAIPRFPMGGPFATFEGFRNKSQMKSLRIKKTRPDSSFFEENPPVLRVEIEPNLVDIENAQFFVQGRKMDIVEINQDSNPPYVILKADRTLNLRRTLYTITAPSVDGSAWHWYSHLWISPDIPE